MRKPFVSIVVPAYNEAKNFRDGLLDPMVNFLSSQKYAIEIIMVDDGSTDDTKKLLEIFVKKVSSGDKQYRLLSIKHGGKAAAVRAGILEAKGEIIFFTDFDQSTPISNMTKFLKSHADGADVVIGIRGGDDSTKHDTLVRKIRSAAFVKLVQIVALPGIKDSQCGFKSFKFEAAQRIFSNMKVTFATKVQGGYMGAWDVEALYLARKLNLRIGQIPVDWVKIESEKLNIWREPIRMVLDTFKIRLTDLTGQYSL